MSGQKATSRRTSRGLLAIIIIAGLCLSTACGDSNAKPNTSYDSQLKYTISIPHFQGEVSGESDPLFFSLPAYRLCENDDPLLAAIETNEDDEYIVGENAKLNGTGVESLEGMEISLDVIPLSEIIEDNDAFVLDLIDVYEQRYDVTLSEEQKKTVSGNIAKYIPQHSLISMNISFDDALMEEAEIRQIEIPDLDFVYSFDTFEIRRSDYSIEADSPLGGQDRIFDFDSFSGLFVGRPVLQLGYWNVEGTALKDIKSVNCISLNDTSTVVNKENFAKYAKEDFADRLEVSSVDADEIEREQHFQSNYYYVFSDDMNTLDGNVASLVLHTITDNGEESWDLAYQPSIVAGEYLLLYKIHEDLQ